MNTHQKWKGKGWINIADKYELEEKRYKFEYPKTNNKCIPKTSKKASL